MTPYTKKIVELHKIHKAIENCGCNKDNEQGGGESNSLFKHYPIAFIDLANWNSGWIWSNENLIVFKNDIKDINTLSEYLNGIDDAAAPAIMFLYDKDTIFSDDELILRGTYSNRPYSISYRYLNDDKVYTNISSCSLQDGEDTYICNYYYD